MKTFTNITFALLLAILPLISFAGVGLGDWTCETPGGNVINNNGGLYIELKNGQALSDVSKWFFYKDHIIGEREGGTYFVVDESSAKVDTFASQSAWIKYRGEHGLNPNVWTRWYRTDWKFLDDDFWFLAFALFYISIPIFVLLIIVGYKAISREKLNFKKPNTLILTIVVGLILLEVILEQFPQSV